MLTVPLSMSLFFILDSQTTIKVLLNKLFGNTPNGIISFTSMCKLISFFSYYVRAQYNVCPEIRDDGKTTLGSVLRGAQCNVKGHEKKLL